ncbi:MAG: hypothetical protein CM1200mP30_23540 [Pseudomonadota bacterium]|nr:MAG: hypothetical protein CM1200mP30_23540 [Pseudomonadota bacterium]
MLKPNFLLEGQELTVSLLIEPHGELVDDLTDSKADFLRGKNRSKDGH